MGDSLSAAIGELWPQFKPQELARVAVLERALAKGEALTEAERKDAQEEAHRLAGMLAVLGQAKAAETARELERRFLDGTQRADAEALTALAHAIRAALEPAEKPPPLGSPP